MSRVESRQIGDLRLSSTTSIPLGAVGWSLCRSVSSSKSNYRVFSSNVIWEKSPYIYLCEYVYVSVRLLLIGKLIGKINENDGTLQ